MEYSRRNFTEQSNRLIAFNGIVKHFTSLLSQDHFTAGVWNKDLIPGLLRYNNNLRSQYQAETKYQVPSWSWLSQASEIFYSSNERRHGYKIARLKRI